MGVWFDPFTHQIYKQENPVFFLMGPNMYPMSGRSVAI